MIKKIAIILCFFSLLAACSSEEKKQQPKDCMENIPTSISGLKIKGIRSEKNVIKNLWPVVCRAQEMYREALKKHPELKGILELKLVVEFNGEIGPHSIERSTLKNRAFEKQILRLIQFMDFDPFGSQNSEAEILIPIQFRP